MISIHTLLLLHLSHEECTPIPPQANAREVGTYLHACLTKLADSHPSHIGFIHGHGLYMGVEIITRRSSDTPRGSSAVDAGELNQPAASTVHTSHTCSTSMSPGVTIVPPPGTAKAKAICQRMLELGVICHATGDHSNVMKVKPPLCFSIRDADQFVDILDQALKELGV